MNHCEWSVFTIDKIACPARLPTCWHTGKAALGSLGDPSTRYNPAFWPGCSAANPCFWAHSRPLQGGGIIYQRANNTLFIRFFMSTDIVFTKAYFTQSAPSIRECPPESGYEVAFAGRSNAGKSSAINALTNNHKLARTSKTPGRTQLINFFNLSDTQRLVDLPGYGYAKVSREQKEKWQRDLSEYLQRRQCLQGLILLMDIRHPLQPFDTTMLKWAVQGEMPIHILLTKADKLSRSQAKQALFGVIKSLKSMELDQVTSVQCFSALHNTGVDELKQKLQSWLAPEAFAEQSPVDARAPDQGV